MKVARDVLDAELLRLRCVVLRRSVAKERWAVPRDFESLVAVLSDAEVVVHVKRFNSGVMGMVRRITSALPWT